MVNGTALPAARRRTLRLFIESIDRWRAEASRTDPAETTKIILDESGYTEMWQRDKSIQAPARLENLKELVVALTDFENLEEFLDHVSLVTDGDVAIDGDMISIMTLHAAKGLEFDTVILPGWEEDLFPHKRALEEDGNKGLEEERRLAYVALTRARHRVAIFHAATRRIYSHTTSNLPSRFLAELPGEHVQTDESPLVGYRNREEFGEPVTDSNFSRTLARRQQQFPSQDVPAAPTTGAPPEPDTRIFHQKFGYGRVLKADGEKLDIAFEKAGRKKIMAAFVTPA